ncbi:ATP synthase protein I [Polynucleobacter meluiroseus]|uniref:ATP synthase protein I n=2 Tax=Polynucleobacter meluiroseus TaxID=1938814 RepID=A0A240E0M4_9BURK|nr:ATP synthase protein I [Polynucleobacter meluiroseus]
MSKHPLTQSNQWDEPEEDFVRPLSKAEMDALRQKDPKKFMSINGWVVVSSQIVLTLIIGTLCYFFGNATERSMYTYSAFVGGLIGFLPSALFLARLEVAKRSAISSPGGYLTAVVSGEFLKILATVLLFIAFALKQPDLKWIPLLVTYFLTLKCYLVVWVLR